jgi:CRISPR type I-E-associated protein CasB/Cse2
MSRPLSFRRDPEAAATLLDWYRALPEDPMARARLRRASNPVAIGYEPAYHRLLNGLLNALPGAERARLENRLGLAAVAGLAARVREHVPGASLAAQMARPLRPGVPLVSEGRFRRLLAVVDPGERYGHLARIVQLLGERLDLLSLADAAYGFDPSLRQTWAYDYYASIPMAPHARRGA